jgi:di/tricarboxylate transporter
VLPVGEPWLALLLILCFSASVATFVSHTVAALILLPVISTIGVSLGFPVVAVVGSAFAGVTLFSLFYLLFFIDQIFIIFYYCWYLFSINSLCGNGVTFFIFSKCQLSFDGR